MPGLNSEQVAFYREQGYLLVEDVIPEAAFQPLIEDLNAAVDRNARRAYAEGRLADLFEAEPFEHRLARVCEAVGDSREMLRGIHGKLKTAGVFAVLTHPAVLDIVESLIGPEILAHPQYNIRAKLPYQDAGVVPWHQDLGYLEPDAEETFMVNFWVPLVDATAENGCMEVVAGSHQKPLIRHVEKLGPAQNFKGIVDEDLPEGAQVLCPVRKGGVLLIQHKTIHRSIPNVSDHIRWSMDIRYSDPAMPTGRESVPGFIARSKAHPERVAKNHLEWMEAVERAQTV